MNEFINVYEFGATGDGITDDTHAIQKAIDIATEKGATVYIPQGTFVCSTLKLKPHVGLRGDPTWSYRNFGGSILQLSSENTNCLLDLTGAYGVTLNGLCLDGKNLGNGIHGVMIDKSDYGSEEDTPIIERCRISNFTGDGIHLNRIWLFSVRHCMVSRNQKNGLWVRGWDGFVLDNWFSGNKGAGYCASEENASVTITGNRFEWNAMGGIAIYGGEKYNITGNYIDRSGKAAISLLPKGDQINSTFSITGNVIYRSGAPNWGNPEEYESTHLRFENVHGLVCSGNTMEAGRDDNEKGQWSPHYAIIYHSLRNSIIKDNAMHNGALKKLIVDLGNHKEGVIVKDNCGIIFDSL